MENVNREILKRIKKKIENAKKQNEKLKQEMATVEKEEVENFLFMACGGGKMVKGMHYPDTAFRKEDPIPMVWPTSDKDVYIAAWPQSYISKKLEEIEEAHEESEWEANWKIFLQELLDVSAEKVDGFIDGPSQND